MQEPSAGSEGPEARHQAHHEYTYRLPMLPRIVVPPPTLATNMPGLAIGSSIRDGEMGFLRDMDLEDTVQKNALHDWAYERRRQAQMILPWLYLGPMLAAKDTAFIQQEGITMVLAIRSRPKSMMGALNVAAQAGIQIATIEASTYFDLTGRLTETTHLINKHVAQFRKLMTQKTGIPTLGKVLVFCESGNEKSAAVVAAYLMETLENFDHIKAMQICQAQRFCVNFDDSIKHMLRSHWDILLARRSVTTYEARESSEYNENSVEITSGLPSIPALIATNKRSIENTCDDQDVDMDRSDALRFIDRNTTPFYNF